MIRTPHPDPVGPADPETTASLSARLEAAAQARLGRSLAIRHVNTGSCNGCELELRSLSNVQYDLERFGLRFVESPRHADVLLVTGPLTRNLRTALEQAESLEQLRALEHGYAIAVRPTPEPFPPGIDTPEDLERAERWLAGQGV